MEQANKKAMRDIFKIKKDNSIIDHILKKQKRRGYRTFADPTIWKKKDDVISGQGVINANLFNQYKNSNTRYLQYQDQNQSSRKSLNSIQKGRKSSEFSSTKSNGRKERRGESLRARLNTCLINNKKNSIPVKSHNRAIKLSMNSPKLKATSKEEPEYSNITKINKKDLSLIQEKNEDKKVNVLKKNKIKITRNKKRRVAKPSELQTKLEKALNDLDDCKDEYKRDVETPIKSSGSFANVYSPSNRLNSAPYQPSNSFYSTNLNGHFKTLYNGVGSPLPSEKKSSGKDINFTIDVNGVPHSVKMSGTETTDASVTQAKEITELKEKLYVSEMLMKKLYVQNQEMVEKLKKQEEKMSKMDQDHRTLQKQHLLLQHNIQNKIMATRLSNFSQNTLGFKDRPRRNSFDKFEKIQGMKSEVTSFWSDLRQSTNNFLHTESIDEDLAKRINNVFQSQCAKSPSRMEYTDFEKQDTN